VPLLGLLPALARDPLAVFTRARALGDVVRLAVPGRQPVFVLAHPAHIRQVLQENNSNYRRTPFHDRLKVVLGEGLVTSEGELWQQQRQLLQPAFRAEPIRRFVPIVGKLSLDWAMRWNEAGKTQQVLDISQEMSNLALSIVVRCIFGQEPPDGDAGIGAAVQVAQQWLAERFWSLTPDWTERLWTPANRRFRRALAVLDDAVQRIISQRLRTRDLGDDLLGMLLAAQQEGNTGIDPRQVRDEVMTMLLAGHETSAAALTWVWHLLAEIPSAAEYLCDEVNGIVGELRAPEPEDLARLSMTRAVIQETMRLYPPVGWFGRLAAQPDRIGGYAIPSGAILILSPWLIQRDARLWANPDRLEPSRFLTGERLAPYTYFPFGGGPRTCLGNHFAMTEMLVVLAILAPRFRLVHANPARPVQPELLITLRPAGGLPMTVIPRERALEPVE
jgi:cytochrome P450